jgi:MoaA/NifB/PqqE/SkfB family radical SAM enzyme
MYNLNQIKTVHLEVTSRCQATCPMCARNIQGLDNPWLELDEITLDQFKQWFPVDFIKQLDRLYMCGNLGDPIVAKDTLKIFQYLRETNPTISLSMNTNGSAKSWHFWKGLAGLKVHVRFGIDGLIDTHSLYRIGTDWVKIIDNARLFINAGGEATWDMLVFEHNEHQVEICRELSEQLGFKNFVSKNTSRFREDKLQVLNKDGTTSHVLFPSIKSKKISKLLGTDEPAEISCKVLNEKSIYINAKGQVIPCCWLDYNAMLPIHPSRVDMLDKGIKFETLKEKTLDEIFGEKTFTTIRDSWGTSPVRECSRQCGKIDKFNEQFN